MGLEFVNGGGVLPGAKQLAQPLGVPPNQAVIDTEFNDLTQFMDDLRKWIKGQTGLNWFGISNNPTEPKSSAGRAKLRLSGDRVQASINGGEYQSFTTPTLVVNVKDYGAIGDGAVDDTVAIQAAINVLSGTGNGLAGNAGKSGILYFPNGTYKISSTLTYVGNNNITLTVRGDGKDGGGSNGTDILWYGSAGGVMFHTFGMNQSRFESINFNGRAQAGVFAGPLYVFQCDTNQPAAGAGSAGNVFWCCGFSGWSGAGSAGFALGRPANTQQISELDFFGCTFGTDSTLAQAGSCLRNLQPTTGNAKNIRVVGGSMNGCDYGVANINSGSVSLSNIFFGNIKLACVQAGASQNLAMVGCEIETGFNETKLVTGSGGTNTNYSSIVLIGNNFNSQSLLGSAVAVDHFGQIVMIGNYISMGTAIPQIQIDPASSSSSLVSISNTYQNALGALGVVNYSSVALNDRVSIYSLNDMGTVAGQTITRRLRQKGGTPAGQATLGAGGTVTVSTAQAVAGPPPSWIFLSRASIAGAAGNLTYTITDGVSFTINSDNAADRSVVNWEILNS